MKRFLLPFAALTALVVLSSHDMFLKLDTYFLEPNTPSEVKLYNGTFEESGNFIRRKRMADVSMVINGVRSKVDTAQWSNRDSMTVLSFTTGAPGTYVAGVSLDPWEIELAADKFNDYLASDGGADMLESRRAEGVLEQDAVEQYAKHAKVIFQVGDTKSDDWNTTLGYPIEFVPLSNPYDLHPGEELQVKLLFKGQPLANQLVLLGSVESHDHGDEHEHEHAHADGTTHSHEHAPDHEHVGNATAASGPDHTHEHAHADGTKHSHGHAPDHEHAGDATAAAHTHDHAHADGTKHSHEHTTDHEHADDATAASGPDHTHEHAHANGTKHSHEHAPDHEHTDDAAAAAIAAHGHEHAPTQELRTDADGIVRVTAAHDGFWHLRTIHMVKSAAEGLTHESNWATLSFEVSHDHSHADGAHDHDHGGVPSYVYWIGSLALVGGLFYFFNRKS